MGGRISKSKRTKFAQIKRILKKMFNNCLVLGIDLGTSGVRIAIINAKKKYYSHHPQNTLKVLKYLETG